jgi:hypothetical protein
MILRQPQLCNPGYTALSTNRALYAGRQKKSGWRNIKLELKYKVKIKVKIKVKVKIKAKAWRKTQY